MRPVVLSLNEIQNTDEIQRLASHAFLHLLMLQGADCKGLLINGNASARSEEVFSESGISYFLLNALPAFTPQSADEALPEYCHDYLDVLSPDVLVLNTLSKNISPWIMAAAERGITIVLDLSLNAQPQKQFASLIPRLLVSFISQVWVATGKQRQALLALKIPANICSALKVAPQQLGYVAKSTEPLWHLLRDRYETDNALTSLDISTADLSTLRIAAIMDEFTRGCFDPEAKLLHLTPNHVVAQLERFKPQLFFIESAWKGINDSWKLQISNRGEALMQAVSWCRMYNVPILFWNKEDPVHFATFLPTAAAADWVFTTDIDCIPRYKAALGHEQVSLLPFAAQTAMHNPIEQYQRKDAFNFAGSYYLRYPQRQQDFNTVIDAVSELKQVDIYDRNANNPHPHYMFPERYTPLILGSLPFSEIDKAYKGYRYGINMNTIKQSQTMFARRVFELLACNTVVVSNYSRGVRNMFGELVICSDNKQQLTNQLARLCEDDNYYQKFRLAGLRKVMSEHTYRHRLAYIAGLIFGAGSYIADEPEVLVVAVANSEAEQVQLLASYKCQAYLNKRLLLLQRFSAAKALKLKTVTAVTTITDFTAIYAKATPPYVACFAADDFYGAHYLTDLLLARRYSNAAGFTKAQYHYVQAGDVLLNAERPTYQIVANGKLRASVLPKAQLSAERLECWFDADELEFADAELVSVDAYNYCYQASKLSDNDKLHAVQDLVFADTGQCLVSQVYPLSVKMPAKSANTEYGTDSAELTSFNALQLNALIAPTLPQGIEREVLEQQLVFSSRLAPDKHAYVYLQQRMSREQMNLVVNSQFQLVVAQSTGDIRTVFEFYSASGQRLGHSINRHPGEKHSLAIPEQCEMIRFGLRFQGNSRVCLNNLVLGAIAETADVLTAKATTLVLTKQYPAYDDLYKYGFLHSRVRAYRKQGVAVDVFKISAGRGQVYREFEDVDVTEGNYELLDQTLASGQYKHVLVHFLDNKKWQVLQKHLDNIKITVWVHGSEIQVWQRREYEFERLSAAEIERQKKLSAARVNFWKTVLQPVHANLKLVFVSDYFANESFTDIGVTVPVKSYSIIHNYVDTQLFNYLPKPEAQRLKLLSIRPYASRKYANDLTINAILLLSNKPFFTELDICLVGDGALFEELTAPLAKFSNVKLIKGFMQHGQIAELHKAYGVFLTPTRMDSQGVSRDEAMSSGLVAITTNVAAIPEFIDPNCGFVVPAEDAQAIADVVEQMYYQPEIFTRLSAAAAQRVRRQCGFEQTISQEIQLIGNML